MCNETKKQINQEPKTPGVHAGERGEEMTVNEFIKELQKLPDWKKEKEIVTIAPNGLEFEPKLRNKLIDYYDRLNVGESNFESTVIYYE